MGAMYRGCNDGAMVGAMMVSSGRAEGNEGGRLGNDVPLV